MLLLSGGEFCRHAGEQYRRVTYDITMAAAKALARANPDMTFIYVTGAGTDSTEHGRTMWARVKGETENALLRLPFRAAYMFRPAGIQPLHGRITSKAKWVQACPVYTVTNPLLSWMQRFPKYITTTEKLGRAMIKVARQGYPKRVLESLDINSV